MALLLILVSYSYPEAVRLVGQGEFQAALGAIDSALAEQPGDLAWAELRVKALLGLGKTGEALAQAKETGQSARSADEYYRLFYLFRYAGQENAGIGLLRDARRVLGDKYAFAREFYLFHAAGGDMDRALPELFACSFDPKLRFWLGDEALTLASQGVDVAHRLSDWLAENPHPDWAEELCYDLALAQNRWELAARWAGTDRKLLDVAQRALEAREAGEALSILGGIKQKDDAYYALVGRCYEAQGKYRNAEAAYGNIENKALRETRLAGLYVGAYGRPEKALAGSDRDKVEALLAMGELEKALALCQQLPRPDRLFYTGKIGLFQGQDWAQDTLKKFVALFSRDERATQALGWIEIVSSSENWPEYFSALADLEAGRLEKVLAQQGPDSALAGPFGVLRGRALEKMGKGDEALAIYGKVAGQGGLAGADAAFRGWHLAQDMGQDQKARTFLMILVRKYPRTPYGIIARESLP